MCYNVFTTNNLTTQGDDKMTKNILTKAQLTMAINDFVERNNFFIKRDNKIHDRGYHEVDLEITCSVEEDVIE